MHIGRTVLRVFRHGVNFALPPRCGGCGSIVGEVDSFCFDGGTELDFLGLGCLRCGLPLEATDADLSALCLAKPPRLDRVRAAVASGAMSRSIAMRVNYGRKVALGRTMSRFMQPLLGEVPPKTALAPLPLHRRRLWARGFNQSAMVSKELSRRTGVPRVPDALRRICSTPPLKGMSLRQRRRTVVGAFRTDRTPDLAGWTVVLMDDVLTTGSTANACPRVLKRAGAERVKLLAWARVIRPATIDG